MATIVVVVKSLSESESVGDWAFYELTFNDWSLSQYYGHKKDYVFYLIGGMLGQMLGGGVAISLVASFTISLYLFSFAPQKISPFLCYAFVITILIISTPFEAFFLVSVRQGFATMLVLFACFRIKHTWVQIAFYSVAIGAHIFSVVLVIAILISRFYTLTLLKAMIILLTCLVIGLSMNHQLVLVVLQAMDRSAVLQQYLGSYQLFLIGCIFSIMWFSRGVLPYQALVIGFCCSCLTLLLGGLDYVDRVFWVVVYIAVPGFIKKILNIFAVSFTRKHYDHNTYSDS